VQSGRETGTALGAARLQNPAAAGRGHPGAKTVGAFAMNDAGLESPLHNDSLKRQVKTEFALFDEKREIIDVELNLSS
jgi:hypothetical protein